MADTFTLGILLKLRDEASRGVKAALGGIEALGDEVDETRQRVAKLETGFGQLRGAGLALSGMGIAAGGALLSVVKPAATLQDAIKNTLTLTGETGAEFARMEEGMTKRALELSTVLGISADEVADSFYQVLSAGATALSPQFDALAETALKMSKTVGLAPADAVEVLSDTLHAFEMDVANAGRVADVFFTTSKLTATTVPQLTEAITEAGPAAAAMGLSLEETSAVLAGFAAKGVKGAKAGTAFRMILTRLANPPADAAKALNALQVSVFDASGEMRPMIPILKDLQKNMAGLTGEEKAAALKALAGEEAFSKLGGLLEGNLDTLEDWQAELAAGGSLQLAFSQKMEAATEQVKVLWISVKNLATAIGVPLLDSLSGGAKWLATFLQGITGFAKAHPVLGKIIGVTLAVVAVFGTLAGAALTVTGVIGMFALKWLPLARFGMGAMSSVTVKSAQTLTGWTRALVASARAGKIHALMTMNVSTAAKLAGRSIMHAARATAAWTASTMKSIAVKAAHVASIVAGTVASWASAIASKAAAAAQWLWNIALTANPIGLIIAGVVALIAGIVLLIRNWDVVTAAVSRAFDWLRNLFGSAPDWVLALVFPLGLVIKHFDAVKNAALSVFTTVASAVSSAFDAVRSALSGIFDWIANKVAWVSEKVSAVTGFLEGVGGFLGPAPAFAGAGFVGGGRAGGQMAIAATAPPSERAGISPNPTRGQEAVLPALAMDGGGGGSVDQSVTIQPGAIQIHAVRVDESTIREIDFELAKLIRRRQERR